MRDVQHFRIEAKVLDDVGIACDVAQERQLPITLTLGRHQMDTLVSFYMRSPSGLISSSAQAASSLATTSCNRILPAQNSGGTSY
jgi:extradiol dioxygenase